MERISNRSSNNENTDSTQLPPPPYTAVVYKLDENHFNNNPPPSYTDVDTQSVIYINNYPDPPLTDGYVHANEDAISTNQECIISKNILIYLKITGIITILLGIVAFDIQIATLASKSILYYYYGFWGGVILFSIGISTLVLYKHRRIIDYEKLFRSFFCQMLIVAILFTIGLIIILTDKCDDSATENDGKDETCRKSNKTLKGFLFGMFAAAFLQSIMNAVIFGILKRQHSIN